MRRHHEELSDLTSALQAASEEAAADSFGVRLMRDSLVRRHEELVGEVAGSLEIALRGSAGATGAEVSLVAKVLDSLQETLASIAQVLAGEPTSRGLIPSAIKDLVELRIAEALPGSLQLRLVPTNLPSEEAPPQGSLLDPGGPGDEPPLLDQSMRRLIGLLADSDEQRRPELLQGIADVGPRATTHLQRLSKALGEAGADAELQWRSARTEARVRFARTSAVRLAQTLEEVEERVREVIYTGRLVGGSLVHRRFELEPEGEDASLIAGEVVEQALRQLERLFGQTCTAHVDVREAKLPSGETREGHLLTQLRD